MWGTQVQSLSWEDILEKEMATHSSILVWKFPWTKEPGRLQFMGVTRVSHDLATKSPPPYIHIHLGFPGGSVVKDLPASAGDTGDAGDVSLIHESPDPLEEKMATHFSILA